MVLRIKGRLEDRRLGNLKIEEEEEEEELEIWIKN